MEDNLLRRHRSNSASVDDRNLLWSTTATALRYTLVLSTVSNPTELAEGPRRTRQAEDGTIARSGRRTTKR